MPNRARGGPIGIFDPAPAYAARRDGCPSILSLLSALHCRQEQAVLLRLLNRPAIKANLRPNLAASLNNLLVTVVALLAQ